MPTEELVLGIGGQVWLRILVLAAMGVFVWRMLQLASVLRQGATENRLDHLAHRAMLFAREVLGQSRMFREPIIGWAHPAIFWGFCLFAIASTLMLLGGMLPQWPIPQAEQIPVLGTLVDLFAVIVIVGLIAAGLRRYVFTPEGLQRTWDASLILVLIAALMVTYLLIEAGESFEGSQRFLPAGQGVAAALTAAGVSPPTIEAAGELAWWVHALVLLLFLVYLPYSKHMHLLWAPAAVFLAESPEKGLLPEIVERQASEGPWNPLADFTWRTLLGAYSCAECGRCERVCPAHASGSRLSPREVVHDFKEFVLREGLAGKVRPDAAAPHHVCTTVGGSLSPAALWSCTTCYACMDRCPVRNEHVPLIVQLRRMLVEDGEFDSNLQDALTSLQRYGNSLGKSARKRFEWTKRLERPLKDAHKEPVDWLWFVGDYAAYHPSGARASQKTAALLDAAGLDFGVLQKGENSAGNDVRRVGEEGLFELLREQNVAAFEKAEFQRIVTTDPHTYHTLKHEYAAAGLSKPITHYAELFDDCLQQGKLQVSHPLSGCAVYHDPCYLGRINNIYEPPRRVIDACGLKRVEMPRCRENSVCCGAGGGKFWMAEEEGVRERPAVSRIREAMAVPDVTHFVVACPKDLAMFEDAVKTVGVEDQLRVIDLGELVFEATTRPKTEETEP